PSARGAAALLRGDDAGGRGADPDLGPRLRNGAYAQLSRFVVEALDLPSPAPPRRCRALEALARHQPAPETDAAPVGPLPESEVLRLSFRQIDDYETCPLKYKYVHRLRVPLLVHHRIVYGSAIHKPVQELFRARLLRRP